MKRQRMCEEQTEKVLMEVYNALYKVRSCLAQLHLCICV